jgi:D-alanyl-D-alanine carboxypeptidase
MRNKHFAVSIFAVFLAIIAIAMVFGRENDLADRRFRISYEPRSEKGKAAKAKEAIPAPEITAEGALVAYLAQDGTVDIVYEKGADAPFPIASVSKLMTALVAEKYLDGDSEISVGGREADGTTTPAVPTRSYLLKQLLYPVLIESNNEDADAIALSNGYANFISVMNGEARRLGMSETSFVNATGLDDPPYNQSSPRDILALSLEITKKYPELWNISALSKYSLRTADGSYIRILETTNPAIKSATFPYGILGGKTGQTPVAKQALVLITAAPDGKGKIFSVVLRSDDRFADTVKLLDWMHSTEINNS